MMVGYSAMAEKGDVGLVEGGESAPALPKKWSHRSCESAATG